MSNNERKDSDVGEADRKLAKYGVVLRKDASGRIAPHAYSEQNGGVLAPVSLAHGSEPAELFDRFMRGRRK